ncbi:hypothetical protein BJ912DRAFT_1079684, partial [Pholiota molesta]
HRDSTTFVESFVESFIVVSSSRLSFPPSSFEFWGAPSLGSRELCIFRRGTLAVACVWRRSAFLLYAAVHVWAAIAAVIPWRECKCQMLLPACSSSRVAGSRWYSDSALGICLVFVLRCGVRAMEVDDRALHGKLWVMVVVVHLSEHVRSHASGVVFRRK